MASKTRLYKVTSANGLRLVETTSPARAIAYVARAEISAMIPAQHEIYAMAKSGLEIEIPMEGLLSDETRTSVSQGQLSV